jgi:hypothetical protein
MYSYNYFHSVNSAVHVTDVEIYACSADIVCSVYRIEHVTASLMSFTAFY